MASAFLAESDSEEIMPLGQTPETIVCLENTYRSVIQAVCEDSHCDKKGAVVSTTPLLCKWSEWFVQPSQKDVKN